MDIYLLRRGWQFGRVILRVILIEVLGQIETTLAKSKKQLKVVRGVDGQTLNPRAANINDQTPRRVKDTFKVRGETLEPLNIAVGIFIPIRLLTY